jgi:hypothetical protein
MSIRRFSLPQLVCSYWASRAWDGSFASSAFLGLDAPDSSWFFCHAWC